MLAFLGDIHGNKQVLTNVLNQVKVLHKEVKAIIQVGDFGFYPKNLPFYHVAHPEIPIYVVEGNHEYYPLFEGYTEVHEMEKNIFHVPRGTIMELDGKKLAFCGGAASIDKNYRVPGSSWFPEELITDADVAKFEGVTGVDILVTHTPPNWMIQKHFDKSMLVAFGFSRNWVDPSAVRIEKIWNMLGQPKTICGHMHRSIQDGNVRILDINEVLFDF